MEKFQATAAGRLRYNPRGSNQHTLILELSGDWLRYAQWQIRGVEPRRLARVQDPDFNHGGQTRHDPKPGLLGGVLLRPDWGCHITIVRGERLQTNARDWGRIQPGAEITFKVDLDPWYNDRHLWYDVECDYFSTIREHYGLGRPRGQYHVSAGVWDEPTPEFGTSRRKFLSHF